MNFKMVTTKHTIKGGAPLKMGPCVTDGLLGCGARPTWALEPTPFTSSAAS